MLVSGRSASARAARQLLRAARRSVHDDRSSRQVVGLGLPAYATRQIDASFQPACTRRAFLHSSSLSSRPALRSAEASASDATAPIPPPEPEETVTGAKEKMEFQAETRALLDIVTHSLYTDKEVFMRELISNASDAMEKARHLLAVGKTLSDPDIPFTITISTDEAKNTVTITDTGIGMTHEELVSNLGTIARSGSKAFLQKVQQEGGLVSASSIIGQFGVGFYSAFMVSDSVTVFTRSATPGSKGYCWTSDGSGTYEVAEAEGVARGTKVILHLKDSAKDYSGPDFVQRVVQKYSNFVAYPISLNGNVVNTVQALWTKDKAAITDADYNEFYRFIANAFDNPMLRLHFKTDSPISIQSLFFVPEEHFEKYGMGRMEPGINVYSRKVLIQAKAKSIVPDWLRFVRGVVDSEDIPLNISREHMQDSALIRRISTVITRRLIKFFQDEAKTHPEAYAKFWKEYALFIKEGIVTDSANAKELARLLRYESSKSASGEVISLETYVSRMKPDQKYIYFLVVTNRDAALASPYLDAFNLSDTEVLFLYQSSDDFVMHALGEFEKKELKSIESADVEPPKVDQAAPPAHALNNDDATELAAWLQDELSDRVKAVVVSDRPMSTPAIVVGHESAQVRRLTLIMDPANAGKLPKQRLELNPRHIVNYRLYNIYKTDRSLANLVALQLLDNALLAAGLLDDPRGIVERLTVLLERSLPDPGTSKS